MGSSQIERTQVVIVGAGPVGLYTAIALGTSGINTVVLERNSGVRDHGGATHLAAELLQHLVRFGMGEYVKQETMAKPLFNNYKDGIARPSGNLSDVVFYVPNFEHGPFARLPPVSMIYQGDLEHALLAKAKALPNVTVCFSRPVTAVSQTAAAEHCMRISTPNGDILAQYVVGADGAKSMVREAACIELEDMDGGRKHAFGIYDLKVKSTRALERMGYAKESYMLCSAARPVAFFPMPRRRVRFGYWLTEGETFEDTLTPESVTKLLADVGLEDLEPGVDYEIDRLAPYWLRYKVAQRMHRDRIFLVGDAAQVMGPFMGQGLNQGLRAATNLAWKLALVLAPDKNEGHTHMSFMKALSSFDIEMKASASKAVNVTKIAMFVFHTRRKWKAKLRDWLLAPFAKNVIVPNGIAKTLLYAPSDLTDMVNSTGAVLPTKKSLAQAAGTVFVQPFVLDVDQDSDHATPLFERVQKNHLAFQIIGFDLDPQELLDDAALASLRSTLHVAFICVQTLALRVKCRLNTINVVEQTTTEPTDVFRKWRDLHRKPDIVIVRPDLYVYATLRRTDLQEALGDLLTSLTDGGAP